MLDVYPIYIEMIFSKTNLGRVTAFDPQCSLPIAQKNLLRLIDGKTPLVTLSRSMDSSSCSIELIDALLNQDLIRLASERSNSGFTDSHPPQRSSYLSATSTHDDRTIPAQLSSLQEASPEHKVRRAEKLGVAKESIATFVLTYLPAYATLVLKDIEDIANGQQLAATIDAVSSMANQSDSVSPVHIKELRQAVRHLLSD